MDPAESILSMLDYTLDSHVESDFGLPALDMNFGFDDIFSNDFFSSNENIISDVLNDDLLDSFEYTTSSDNDLYQSLLGSKSLISRNKSRNFTGRNSTSVSLLNNTGDKKSKTTQQQQHTPKVYINKPKPKGEGVSILVKKKKAKKQSLLQSSIIRPSHQGSVRSKGIFDSTDLRNGPFWYATLDHDYCLKSEMPNFSSITDSKNFTPTDTVTEATNDLDDFLQGFISDDVMLNELPNCLKDLVDLDNQLLLNSEDVLHGLNDACNLMTDHYIEDLYNINHEVNLPNLNITEEDLNETVKIDESIKDCATSKDIELDIVCSPFTESLTDNFDSASVTTGCTDESFSEAQSVGYLLTKSKRHRTLSSSSVNSKRKRRFSTRSSLNSSDSMSDYSIDSASSSRCSSPDRQINFTGFKSFSSGSSCSSSASSSKSSKKPLKCHNNSTKYLNKKNRFRKNNWSKYTNKYNSKKCKVIDLANRKHENIQYSRKGPSQELTNGGEVAINERVLYIGDIPSGTLKSDIKNWFSKYGAIVDVQVCFGDNSKNFAFVTYECSHHATNAIKHGNDDLSHPKFILSYGRRKNTLYKDLDLFSESNLDFRIDSNKSETDFDTLLRSTAETYKHKTYI